MEAWIRVHSNDKDSLDLAGFEDKDMLRKAMDYAQEIVQERR